MTGTLPVDGSALVLREPTGRDEAFLVEAATPPVRTLVDLLVRLDLHRDEAAVLALPAADLAAAALLLRRAWLGNTVRTVGRCGNPDCDERVDVSFPVDGYLAHHRPRRPRGVVTAGGSWLTWPASTVRFRAPTVGDLLDALAGDDPDQLLTSRCVTPDATPGELRRVDRALAALAPNLTDLLQGTCPGCARSLELEFDPVSYVLAELRDHCASVFGDVDALARAYGWPEAAILRMARSRRRRYVALLTGSAVY